MTLIRTAVEFSIRLAYKIIAKKKPEKLFRGIFDEEEGRIKSISDEEIKTMTKIRRRTWKVRVLRYLKILPNEFLLMDPTSCIFKRSLREWIMMSIEPNGDPIFKGRISSLTEEDWLEAELRQWRDSEAHNFESNIQFQDIEE